MKTPSNYDNNPIGMKIARSASEEAIGRQHEKGFIGRVYRTTLVVWAVAAAVVYGHYGPSAVVGLSIGAGISLGSLRTIEWAVRRLLRPDVPSEARQFTVLFFLKLPLLTVVMTGAVWTVMTGVANVFALVGGVAMVHMVILLKAIGAALVTGMVGEAAPGIRTVRATHGTETAVAPIGRGRGAPRGAAEGTAAAQATRRAGPRVTPQPRKWGDRYPVTD